MAEILVCSLLGSEVDPQNICTVQACILFKCLKCCPNWNFYLDWTYGEKKKTDTKNNRNSPVIPIPTAFKLVKDAIILIKWTQFTPEVFMHLLKEINEDDSVLINTHAKVITRLQEMG